MRLSGTKTGSVNTYKGLGDQLYDLGGARPTLDLNFANNNSLADSITGKTLPTFTRASVGTYVDGDGVIRTSPVNLLRYSEQFDNATWQKQSNVTITPNQTVAPNGTNTADLYSISGITQRAVDLNVSGLTNGNSYVFHFYVKAVVDTTIKIRTQGDNQTLIEEVILASEGFKRISVSFTKTSVVTQLGFFDISGDTGNRFYIWGAQLEEGTTATDYIPTTSTKSGAPRFDHDPATGESLGLLIEESRTNLIKFSDDLSAGWWTRNNAPTASVAVSNPFNYSQVYRLRANTTNNDHRIFRSDNTFLSANTDHTFSLFAAPEGTGSDSGMIQLRVNHLGTSAAIVNFNLNTGQVNAQDGTSGTGSGGATWSISDYGMELFAGGWYRVWMTYQASVGTSVGVVLIDDINASDVGGIYSYTGSGTGGSYLAGIQVEAGGFRTSVIPNDGTTSSVTRAADVAEITGANFSSFYNQSEGTVFAQSRINRVCDTAGTGIAFVDDGTNANHIGLFYRGSGATGCVVRTGGVDSLNTDPYSSAVPANTTIQQAVAYKAGDSVGAGGGNLTATNLSSNIPTVNRLLIGDFVGTGAPLDGHIKRLAYFNTRLPDANLQNITN